MNHREPPHLPMGARRALHCLSLLLLPALVPSPMPAVGRQRTSLGVVADCQEGEQSPYLPLVGAPPLRFQDNSPPPDLSAKPPSAAPPQPHLTQAESSVKMANSAASTSVPAPKPPETNARDATPGSTEPAKAEPVTILPDTVRPQVQAEDFLPFFLIPGTTSKSEGQVPAAPQPGQLPPSTATYTQTPR
jgi:hypothetical protein